jgi:hypothetical protein
MGTYISIIKYYPMNTREEFFGIGIIMFDEKKKVSKYKISEDRIKRINRFYGVDKSIIIEETINNFKDKEFNHNVLNYLSKYENGTIRFSHPKLLNIGNMDEKFDEYFNIYIADNKEQYEREIGALNHSLFRKEIRKRLIEDRVLDKQLNIGYTIKREKLKLLTANTEVDYIGGNGTIFCGQIANLESKNDTIGKTLFLYNIFKELYSTTDKFKPYDCKIILKRDEKENKKNAEIVQTIEEWERSQGYGIITVDNENQLIDNVRNDTMNKNIMPFEKWIEINPPNERTLF